MNYLEEHKKIFGCDKPIIGCLHLLPLPGTPYYNEETTIEKNIERLKHDAAILMENGVDAVVFANEGDRPYLTSVGPEVIAAYVRVVTEVLPMIHVPYGCGCLIDPIATLAIAKAIGAKFIRTYVTNSYEGTFGHQEFCPLKYSDTVIRSMPMMYMFILILMHTLEYAWIHAQLKLKFPAA